ncbi:methionine--tRNA ligase MES1 [Sugiyamaella lignohabitans]|uniref:methionine--tRNA ligase n=1 Tax=Sugiyamaella lignohabitans TaxID=796027 RepID=A0A167FY98_9ASCO|nr:methionine--tRNA ligase MES1 [Sugiyamaella lignohabitans]ANB15856.1 methionine--tRNA ligase MES1 [Sugiyamaella lignohabitans]
MPLELLVPKPTSVLQVSQNAKVIVASAVYGSDVKVVVGDASSSILLKIDSDHSLFEPNAIVEYLSKAKLTSHDWDLISIEETKLYNLLKQGEAKKLDQNISQLLSELLDKVGLKAPLSAGAVIVFGALYGLVATNGKGALSQDLQLTLWYQKFSGESRVKSGLKETDAFVIVAAAASTASKATPAVSTTPLPERTGEKKIASGLQMNIPSGPILPKDGQRNILITSALPYVNNVPHLGNIVGSVLSADIFARYCKARNYNTLFICGTDEYGTATETKAIEENVTPRELCDKFHAIHRDVYKWFQIGFDHFGRTSTPQQTEITQDIFLKLNKNDFLEAQTMEQLYCTQHNGYLADRFVEGTCPKCGYEDARGDQCDNCGNLLNPFELINPRCKLDNSTPVKRDTKHIFLRLDKLQPEIETFNDRAQVEGKWSKNGKTITHNWLKEGLRPRAITRDLKWGVPVPLEEFKDKVMYVWFDACIGYVSITACYTEEWQKWWKNPENVKLYQFMGKDNVPFHSVIFPGSQIGTGEKWTQLHHLNTAEYLQYEGGKFSKSRNIGVFGNNAQEIGISPSVWRYYLSLARPESSDTQFSWQEFVSRNNSELLANLGNFVNRLIKFVNARYNGVIPDYSVDSLPETFPTFKDDINKYLANYNATLEVGASLRQGLEIAMQVSSRGNQFLQDNKLDNSLFANFPEKSAAVVGVGLNLIYLLSALVYPYMPETSHGIIEQLEAPLRVIPDEFDMPLLAGHNIGKAKYLFKRIDEAKIDEWRLKYGGGSGQ